MCYILSIQILFSPAALLILLSGAAGAGIIGINLGLIEMGHEDNDPAIIPDIQQELKEFKETFENIRINTLLSGEYDRNNAILKLNAGAGGTESCD